MVFMVFVCVCVCVFVCVFLGKDRRERRKSFSRDDDEDNVATSITKTTTMAATDFGDGFSLEALFEKLNFPDNITSNLTITLRDNFIKYYGESADDTTILYYDMNDLDMIGIMNHEQQMKLMEWITNIQLTRHRLVVVDSKKRRKITN